MKRANRVPLPIVAVALFFAEIITFGVRVSAQNAEKAPLPEYFGVYALDNGKLTALIGGNSSENRGSQTLELFSFETNSSMRYSVLAFSSEIRFVVFDQASGEVADA
jgi:hypothetical protein